LNFENTPIMSARIEKKNHATNMSSPIAALNEDDDATFIS